MYKTRSQTLQDHIKELEKIISNLEGNNSDIRNAYHELLDGNWKERALKAEEALDEVEKSATYIGAWQEYKRELSSWKERAERAEKKVASEIEAWRQVQTELNHWRARAEKAEEELSKQKGEEGLQDFERLHQHQSELSQWIERAKNLEEANRILKEEALRKHEENAAAIAELNRTIHSLRSTMKF